MPDYPSINRLADLQQLIADFAKINRVPPMGNNERAENDVEHSFGLALTCWYLHPKIAPDLDLLKILKYSLAHDIVELHAGDTFVFDTRRVESKEERERIGLSKVENEWRDFKELSTFAREYMDKSNREARFVKAIDKLLPIIMIELDKNPSDFWNKHVINLEMERKNKVTVLVSEEVAPYYEMLIEWLDERGNIPKH